MRKAHLSDKCRKTLKTSSGSVKIFHLPTLKKCGFEHIDKLPYSIKILLENILRNCDGQGITEGDIRKVIWWHPTKEKNEEISFKPGRVILQDFTGVPAIVDLAAMRSALKRNGGNINKINPQVPCHLVVDHSIQVDAFGSKKALGINTTREFKRNKERYEFLKWGQKAFKNFSVIPPATGIVHQVNLEYLADGVLVKSDKSGRTAFPDSLVGTDSHTTMINGLGIMGWGVGGIEAEAVMLGEPISMLLPDVIGVKFQGSLHEAVTATDLVLTVTEILREKGVVGKFVEYFGEGLKDLSLPDRATLANMAPEYGATMGIFPFDECTLDYYRLTGRSRRQTGLIETYMKAQKLFYSPKDPQAKYTDIVEINLNDVRPCLAGPKRPQDKILLKDMKKQFHTDLSKPLNERGFGLENVALDTPGHASTSTLHHGSVAIAAITSCTNTSNPSVLIAAGLVAKAAVKRGLRVNKLTKTSLAPGSTVVSEYLKNAGLLVYLEKLGFHIVGYGCTTCIGNSGPLKESISEEILKKNLIVAGVLSGNRNFEGRINPHVKANYLASPPLVIAYALAGTVNIDFTCEPIGQNDKGQSIYLKEIWPSPEEINEVIKKSVRPDVYRKKYKDVTKGSSIWGKVKASKSNLFDWDVKSTYIQEPPFFKSETTGERLIESIEEARILLCLGDSVTTDHISPAGAIAPQSPAGSFLKGKKIQAKDFNSYGSRRGNDQVMTRGTFANIRLRNLLLPGTEGGVTRHHPSKKHLSVYEASCRYKKAGTPLIIFAGKEYGTGSSRDWAAKGTSLLGVRAVIAEGYERIHRSNLVGMGILPLQFITGQNFKSLGLAGDEYFNIVVNDKTKPRDKITVEVRKSASSKAHKSFQVLSRIDTPIEVEYYRCGGILQTVLRKLSK